MITLSYKNCCRLLRTVPICPKPKAIGLHNIPRGEPILFVYNHVVKRGEPVFLAMAAPSDPPLRFFIEMTLVGREKFDRTEMDVRNSVFSQRFQEKMERRALTRRALRWAANLLTRFLIAQMSRLNFIPVYLHIPPTREETIRMNQINKKALKSCLESLEKKIPVAIAPSGGSTHEKGERLSIPTTVPSLAEWLNRRGKVLKIIPSVIKEDPVIGKETYRKYIADRILPFRLWRVLLDRLGIKSYRPPRLTVEFLPAVTFTTVRPTKEEKLRFVQEIQQKLYEVLRRD